MLRKMLRCVATSNKKAAYSLAYRVQQWMRPELNIACASFYTAYFKKGFNFLSRVCIEET